MLNCFGDRSCDLGSNAEAPGQNRYIDIAQDVPQLFSKYEKRHTNQLRPQSRT